MLPKGNCSLLHSWNGMGGVSRVVNQQVAILQLQSKSLLNSYKQNHYNVCCQQEKIYVVLMVPKKYIEKTYQ